MISALRCVAQAAPGRAPRTPLATGCAEGRARRCSSRGFACRAIVQARVKRRTGSSFRPEATARLPTPPSRRNDNSPGPCFRRGGAFCGAPDRRPCAQPTRCIAASPPRRRAGAPELTACSRVVENQQASSGRVTSPRPLSCRHPLEQALTVASACLQSDSRPERAMHRAGRSNGDSTRVCAPSRAKQPRHPPMHRGPHVPA